MTEQQILLLGFLFVVGFVAVFGIFSSIERRGANASKNKESATSQSRDGTASNAEEPEQNVHEDPKL